MDWIIPVSMGLLILGGVISGACVGTHTSKAIDGQKWVKIVVGVLVFLVVGVAYYALGMAGCCGVAAVSGLMK